ncbi:hypothetical protein LSTR_LSTR009183 [Laodelphax striatellus]|uniref:EF-hand domain-containing protein n=1 Tax=Laodelphax striatellus TaxID=195883 RepID=A0A482XDZ7_LAOST|nr:hypothetical protein LSTR_LSTR009183 [Laodelphax striatellus]
MSDGITLHAPPELPGLKGGKGGKGGKGAEEDEDYLEELAEKERLLALQRADAKRRESRSVHDVDYVVPAAATKKDIDLLHNIDEEKMQQLRDAFFMFDFDHDGVIGKNDLRVTLQTMGKDDISEEELDAMMSEALHPLDFDAFVVLLGCKTIELDPEEVIRDALSRWDYDGSGKINEQRIKHDLMTWGDKFTQEEVDIALEDAPVHEDFRESPDQRMIDYVQFCKILCGLRAKTE